MKQRLYTAAKPTGRLTLGNYVGAVDNWLKLQNEYDSIFCVADLHSLTVEISPQELRDNSYAVMANYLACGLDPKKCTLYYQSQISAHPELCWLLDCITSMGEASRMTAYKEKAENKNGVSVGLFNYPMLMAADILLYDAKYVPIGEDQRQHLELARNLATRFNNKYGETFTVPEGVYQKVGAKIYNLQNPTKKMSKSDFDNSGNILLEDDLDVIKQKIKRAVTDSDTKIVFDPQNKPGVSNLLSIYSVLTKKDMKSCESFFAGKNYGALKNEVCEVVVETIKPIQEKFNFYMKNKDEIEKIAIEGAEKISGIAENKIKLVKQKMGLIF